MATRKISISQDGIWAGNGTLTADGHIEDCTAILGPDLMDRARSTLSADGWDYSDSDDRLVLAVSDGEDDDADATLDGLRALLGTDYDIDWTGDGNTDARGRSTSDVRVRLDAGARQDAAERAYDAIEQAIRDGAESVEVEGVRYEWTVKYPTYHVDRFVTPPVNQGQIVLVSYGCDGDAGVIVERIYDQSDRTTVYHAYEDPATEPDWAPWNGVPALGDHLGRCEVSEDDQ